MARISEYKGPLFLMVCESNHRHPIRVAHLFMLLACASARLGGQLSLSLKAEKLHVLIPEFAREFGLTNGMLSSYFWAKNGKCEAASLYHQAFPPHNGVYAFTFVTPIEEDEVWGEVRDILSFLHLPNFDKYFRDPQLLLEPTQTIIERVNSRLTASA